VSSERRKQERSAAKGARTASGYPVLKGDMGSWEDPLENDRKIIIFGSWLLQKKFPWKSIFINFVGIYGMGFIFQNLHSKFKKIPHKHKRY